MTQRRRSTLARLVLLAGVVVMVVTGCSLSGGGDDGGSEAQPTVQATVTPPPSKTPRPTFTAFPTLTPFSGSGFQPVPTSTPIGLVFVPTWTPVTIPTWTPSVPSATPYPFDVRISYPVDGSEIAGFVTVVGSASHPRFLQYALEWGPDPNPGNLWYPITNPQTRPVINGALGAINTTTAADNVYQIRVHVWLNDGTETFDLVTGIRISNTAPTAIPTLTPTPRPNRPPTISPIPSQQVNSGAATPLTITTSDPDGDVVSILATSSNNAVVVPEVASPTQLNITGVTAGTATITVTASDGNGGLISTAFIVTVSGLNQAPSISPILNQQINIGQTFNVAVSASDPDGDALAVTATSSDAAIATVSAPDPTTVQLVGVAVGTANITVRADDGKGGAINTTFQVEVGQPNRAPTIDPIPAQTMSVNDSKDVIYIAADADGNTLQASVTSDTPGVVTANITAPGIIRLDAISAGTSTITLSVTDNIISTPVIATFPVTVVQGNVGPTVDAIAPQTMSVGEARDVTFNASDPDNDPLTSSVTSDNTGVVTASVQGSIISLNAAGAGTASVTLTVDDGNNPAVSTTFTVSVANVNVPPTIETIMPQTLGLGDIVDVPFTAVDPDNDPLTPSVTSDNTSVVTASINNGVAITLTVTGAGTATVTLTVDDGNNPTVTMPFSVTVTAANTPPTIQPIAPQTMTVGVPLEVPYAASDLEDPITGTAQSDNGGVVTAVVNTQGVVSLTAVGAGTATVTVSVTDNVNTPVATTFTVTVAAANTPPTIQPIAPQTMTVGVPLEVPYAASDLEDPITGTAQSDNQGVVTAVVNTQGVVSLTAVGAGMATVTVSVTDNVNTPVATSFTVTVAAANANPVIQPIAPQSVDMGASLPVAVQASDPDGDAVALLAASDNPGVATAVNNGPAEVIVTGVAPGTANITVEASDGKGGVATVIFQVTVQGVNNPPVIQPIGDQSLGEGAQLPVQVLVSDADGNPIVLTAISQNAGVVIAEAQGTDTILLTGVSAGSAVVDVTADDALGGITTAAFTVTVTGGGATFDLMAYPVVPSISPEMGQSLAQIYQSGVQSFGNQPGAFSKVGGSAMANTAFLAPFVSPQNLGNYGWLQGTIDFYQPTSVRPGVDPAINSFSVTSAAANAQGFSIDTYNSTLNVAPECQSYGVTQLGCEYTLTKPAIALISFDAANVIYMDPSVFRSELQVIVQETLSTYGVIPVLATIPADGVANSDQLLPYNQAIVEVAQQSGIVGIPLWNLWRAMQENGIGDPYSVAPGGAGDLTGGSLGYGYNQRNLTALQVLDAVRASAGIQ